MAISKKLEIIYHNGQPDGIRSIRRHLSTMTTYVIPRPLLSEAKKLSGINRPGIYYLISENDDNKIAQIYIGQTRNGVVRLDDHNRSSHFQFALTRRGYTYLRGREYKHPCVIAKGWKRPVRIDNLGERYTPEAIEKRILSRREYRTPYYPSRPPLYEIWQRRKGYDQHNTVELIFMIVLELFGIDTSGKIIQNDNYQEPLSPAMRQEQIYLDRYMETVNLINRNDLGTADKVQAFIDEKEAEMAMLLSARNKIDNRRRKATTDAEKEECSRKRKAISKELKAIRHDINLAKEIFPMIENLKEKLRIEMEQEQEMFPRETGAKIQSKTKRNEEKQRSAFTVVPTTRDFAAPVSQLITSEKIPWSRW